MTHLPPSNSLPSPTELDTAVVLPAALETGGISSPDVPPVSSNSMTHEEAIEVAAKAVDPKSFQLPLSTPWTRRQITNDVEKAVAVYLEARGAVLSDADLPQSPWPASDWAIDRIAALEAENLSLREDLNDAEQMLRMGIGEEERYQSRVAKAHKALFEGDPTDIPERSARFCEEANEVCQAFGMTREEAHQLVDYTYGRPSGDPAAEIGAAMLTLTSLCVVAEFDLMVSAESDLRKLQRPETIARIRAKRSTRHGRGPLPGVDMGKGDAS